MDCEDLFARNDNFKCNEMLLAWFLTDRLVGWSIGTFFFFFFFFIFILLVWLFCLLISPHGTGWDKQVWGNIFFLFSFFSFFQKHKSNFSRNSLHVLTHNNILNIEWDLKFTSKNVETEKLISQNSSFILVILTSSV